MKVLIISSWYPNKFNKNSGIFVKKQAKALLSIGVTPIVFFPYDSSVERGEIEKSEEEGILTYRANTYYLKNSKLSQINSIIKSIKFLKSIVKENNIDIIHSHVCYPAGFIAALFKKIYKKPYIITEHMSRVGEFAKKAYNKKFLEFAYKNAERVITVSSSLKNELTELGFSFRGEIISNVVDTNQYFLDSKFKKNNSFNIIFIGSMCATEVKGLQYFIPALSRVIKKNPQYNITFTLIGDGEYRNKYEKMCIEYKIYEKCRFMGIVANNEIPKLIADSDFLVLPSIKETFGCVLIEAMAGGKPVLTTKSGGPEDFVNDKVGVVVKTRSEEALEEGIQKIINNYSEFQGEYIKKYVEDNYSYRAIGYKLYELYSNILKDGGVK